MSTAAEPYSAKTFTFSPAPAPVEAAAPAPVVIPSYFVVMIDYGRRGLEASVDPEITQRGIVARLECGEYTNVAYIHHVHDGIVEDVTSDLFALAGIEEAA